MTKTLTLFFAFLAATLNLLGQNFEGRISYQNTFKTKLPNITDEQWVSMMGSTQDYFIKGGNYRSNTNGTVVQWQMYVNRDNKLYYKVASSETILWNDGASNSDEVLKVELNPAVVKILGYTCDELIFTCKSGVQKYYFAPALQADSSLFARHKYGNFAEYIARAKAIPLKIVVDNAQFILESTASEIKPTLLEDTLFALPEGAQTAKSPY